MNTGSICTRDVTVCGPQASILEAAQLMREQHVGDLVVVETIGGRRVPIGMLTDRDIVLAIVAKQANPEKIFVNDVMSSPPALVNEGDDLWLAASRMRLNGVRRLPVVDTEGALAGIVSLDDLLEAVSKLVSELWLVTGRQSHIEQKNRA
ncbi:CBS domain-containing protein [Paraburkholderia sp. MMS20-SJTN17]|uniref:CBS domain-containing protein n=1 Tax=Paraburkholderia translucens TaxID=2886945 RepID=A0ABS8K703_9BURK|nr:CBS domain-containing protein [Paraburkholderia sp. MMS20-SJTN17]MCC8400518.1 CBS domain-containing protein [Paraburkholderia sp. MMS20-SJTN17]